MELEEQVIENNLDKNADIVKLAKNLMDGVKQYLGHEKHMMQAKGKFIAQADHGSTANVSISSEKG